MNVESGSCAQQSRRLGAVSSLEGMLSGGLVSIVHPQSSVSVYLSVFRGVENENTFLRRPVDTRYYIGATRVLYFLIFTHTVMAFISFMCNWGCRPRITLYMRFGPRGLFPLGPHVYSLYIFIIIPSCVTFECMSWLTWGHLTLSGRYIHVHPPPPPTRRRGWSVHPATGRHLGFAPATRPVPHTAPHPLLLHYGT